MSTFMSDYEERVIHITSKLEDAYMSMNNNHESTEEPFFNPDPEKVLFQVGENEVPDMPSNLNISVQLLYKIIGDPTKEVYYNGWTIMNLQKALRLYDSYVEEGQHDVFDIAFQYRGLGHIRVLSCDLSTHQLFFRPDGGSNGYDREFNHKRMIDNGPDKTNQFYFTQWFNH